MARKSFFVFFISAAFLLFGSFAASAQTVPVLAGKVQLKQADGKTVPVAGATVEAYPTGETSDTTLTAKTDEQGNFSSAAKAGMVYIVSVSAPNASPELVIGVSQGQADFVVSLAPGTGKKYTVEEIDKIVKEKNAQNAAAAAERAKKATNINAIVNKALKEANDAFNSQNYDVAVAKYDEGYNADPTFVGSAPLFLDSKAISLNNRGIGKYNAAVKMSDKTAKTAAYGEARKDFTAAYEASSKALEILKANKPPTEAGELKNYQINRYNGLLQRADAMRLFLLAKGDPGKAAEGVTAYQEYIEVETDVAKKAKAQLTLGELYFNVGDFDSAVPHYRKLVEQNPKNTDALYFLGLALITVAGDDTAKLQEGINAYQQYVDNAPSSDGDKITEAKATIEELKKKNITPQKGNKGNSKKRGN